MKKILITGGLGFIFSHVTEYFLQGGNDVMVMDNLSAGSHPELIPEFRSLAAKHQSRFTFVETDVSYATTIPIITTFNPEYIIHAAAISDVDYSIKNPVKTLQANMNGTMNVFEAARQLKDLKKLLYVSTDEVYGECDHPKTEEEILFPKNPYALSKSFGSQLRLAYDNTYPTLKDRTVETRFCNVFGPRQDSRKVIAAIKESLHMKKPLPLHNGGEGYRQYIHVSEIPPLIGILLEKGHRTYNITAGEGHKVHELIGLVEKILGTRIMVTPGKRQGMDMRYEMSSERIRSEFGWSPSLPFEEHFKNYLSDTTT